MFTPVKTREELLAASRAGLLWRNRDSTVDRSAPQWEVCPTWMHVYYLLYIWDENTDATDDYQRRDFAVYLED